MRVTARFRPHPRGFGFLHIVGADGATPETVSVARDDRSEVTGDRVFVPPPLARGLIADDLVDAEVRADEKGLSANDVNVRERPRRMIVGTVTRGPGRLVLEPHPSLASGWVRLDPSVTAVVEQAVGRVVVVLRAEDDDGGPVGRALVAGPYVARSPQAVRANAAVVALDRAAPALIPGGPARAGLDPAAAAMTHARFVGLVAGGGRGGAAGLDRDGDVPGAGLAPVDRRDEPCLTIDDTHARDLDDALWAVRDGDQIRVAVHIADAARSVGIASAADLYARTVGATAYPAVGANAPMLDPALSENELSLLAGQDRHVISVRLTVGADGSVSDVEIEVAQITSRAQLSYEAVEQWLDGDATAIVDEAGDDAEQALQVLEVLAEASHRLGVERDSRITFEELFASSELVPALVDGKLVAVPAEPHADAYRLVERLMVAANEAVAGWLVAHDVPALYRAHVGIDPERHERIRAAAALAGVTLEALDEAAPAPEHLAAQLLDAIERMNDDDRTDDRALLIAVATGATARATYDPDPAHHRGLAAGAYTHFTSPIRRYADLVVHRQLRATLAGEPTPYGTDDLAGMADWLDARSGAVGFLEARERGDLWSLLLDRGALDEPEPATVTDVGVNGLRIRLPRLGIGGFVTAERALGLPDRERGRFVVDEHGLTTTSGPWRVGSTVTVRFVGLDDTGRPVWRLGDTAER